MEHVSSINVEDVINQTDLTFDRTVTKTLAHKHGIENVYCTAIRMFNDEEFLVGACIPQTNIFFRQTPEPEERNILLLTEIGRQAAIATSHKYLGVPYDRPFVLDKFEIKIAAAHIANESLSSTPLVVRILMKDKKINAKGELTSVATNFEFYQDGVVISTGVSHWSFHDHARYKKLRSITRRRIERRVTPENLVVESSVVTSDAVDYSKVLEEIIQKDDDRFVADLIVDKKHIFFFDHDCDHVPGMLILESFKQIASRSLEKKLGLPRHSMRAHAMTLSFKSFAEINYSVVISASVFEAVIDHKNSVVTGIKLEATQNGQLLAQAEMSVSKQR